MTIFRKLILTLIYSSLSIGFVAAQSTTCNINQIIQTFTGAGYTQLPVQGQPCSIYFYNNSNQSANDAQTSAQALGANLVSIQSQAENDALQQGLQAAGFSGAVVWIGGRFNSAAHGPNDFSWLDGTPVNYTNWNGAEPNNSSGVPGVSENCMNLIVNSGQWNDLVCGAEPLGLGPRGTSVIEVNLCPQVNATGPGATICENSSTTLNATALFGSTPFTFNWDNGAGSGASVTVSPAQTTTYTVTASDRYSCSASAQVTVTTQVCNQPVTTCNLQQIIQTFTNAGYTELNVQGQDCSKYFYNNNNLTWNNAQSAAQNLGANLVSISDQTENNAITQAIAAAGLNGVVWIGFTEQNSPGTYNWTDGSTVNFINWNPGEPNNSSGFPGVGEDCAQLQTNGFWNDLMCGNAGLFPAPTGRSIIEVALCPQVSVTGPTTAICEGTPTSLSASAILGSTPYTFNWSNGAGSGTTVNVSPTQNTTYVVTVTDRYSCTDTASINVTVQNCSQPICDVVAIRAAFQGAGYTEITTCNNLSPCSMYFLNPNNLDGNSAQSAAQQLGANLVSIQSATENQCLTSWLAGNGFGSNDYVMIGLNDITTEGTFVWYDQNAVTFTNWQNGEPNNQGNEDCVQLRPNNGLWNDIPCGQSNSGSIIEVNLCPQLTVSPAATICQGETTQLTGATILGSNPYTYSWDNNAGTGSPISVSPQNTTTYSVTVSDRYSCTASGSTIVDVIPGPTTTFTATPTVCVGQNATITYTGNANAQAPYTWDFDGGTIVSGSGQGPYQISWTTPGVKNVSLDISSGSGNCAAGATIVQVNVTPQPVPNAGQDATICSGGTLQLGGLANPGATYEWTPATNLSNANISNPTFTFSNQSQQATSFTYTLTENISGCIGTTTVTITVDPAQPLNVTINGDAQFCEGESVTLDADAGFNNYTWNDGTQGASYTISSAGSYFVTAEDAQGCEFISSATPVIVFDKPEIALDVLNNVSCFGFNDGNASFVSTGGTPAYQYFFDDATPIQGNSVNSLAPADYTIIVVDGVQCSDTISFTITEPSAPLGIDLIQLENVRCFGESSGNILVTGTGGTEPYSYLWSNGDSDENAGSIPVGNFIVTVTDANGCTETDSYDIIQPEPIVVTIQPEYEVLLGNAVVLEPVYSGSDSLFFNWSPEVYLSNATIDTPSARPFQTTTYTITVSDSNQCEASASTTVFVNDSIKIYIPNIFSPNADGINDVFLVYANAVKDIYVTVFNRWGEKVFESKDITLGWDGTYKGKLAPEGVYVYYVQFTFLNFTQQKKKGSITLVR